MTVVGKDRPGIIAKVTAFLFRRRSNLEDISMTVLEGELAMSLMVRLPFAQVKDIQKELLSFEKIWKLTFFWKNLPAAPAQKLKQPPRSNKFIISALGLDKMGIVYHISRVLSRFNLNITDLNSRILTYAKKPVYALVLEVDIPISFSIPRLKRRLDSLRRKLRLDISLKRVEEVAF